MQQTGFTSVLWSSCLAMLAVGANGTAIMAALPTMRTELFLSSAGVQWAVNAYLVVSAACIVLGGQAADRFENELEYGQFTEWVVRELRFGTRKAGSREADLRKADMLMFWRGTR
jgi:MFS family permease